MAKHLRGKLLIHLTEVEIDRLVELDHLRRQPGTDLYWTQGGPSRWSQEGQDIWAKRPKHGNQKNTEERGGQRFTGPREEHVRRCKGGNCQEFYPMHPAGGSQCKDLTPCRICGEPIVCDGKRLYLEPESKPAVDETGELPKPPWATGQQLELFPEVPA